MRFRTDQYHSVWMIAMKIRKTPVPAPSGTRAKHNKAPMEVAAMVASRVNRMMWLGYARMRNNQAVPITPPTTAMVTRMALLRPGRRREKRETERTHASPQRVASNSAPPAQ